MLLQIAGVVCIIPSIIAAIFIVLGTMFFGFMLWEVIKDDWRKHNRKE